MFLSIGSTFVKQNKDRNSKTKNVDNSAYVYYYYIVIVTQSVT